MTIKQLVAADVELAKSVFNLAALSLLTHLSEVYSFGLSSLLCITNYRKGYNLNLSAWRMCLYARVNIGFVFLHGHQVFWTTEMKE